MASSGLRTISWKCVVEGCPYYARTVEGTLNENGPKQHNHEKQPELVAKKEARHLLFKRIAEGVDSGTPMSHFLLDVQQETEPDILKKIGSLDGLRHAFNRYKRKRIQKEEVVEVEVIEDTVVELEEF